MVCWRSLADRVVATLRVGDPVIVRGRLRSREYEKDGQVHRVVEVEATSIGPDLARCAAAVLRRDSESASGGDAPTRQSVGNTVEEDLQEAASRAEAGVGV